MKFAKIFERDEMQVLVMLDSNDDGDAAVKFFAKPEELGVCCVSASFSDTAEGYEQAEQMFEAVTEEQAFDAVDHIFAFDIAGLLSDD